jgi:hypothetical protein
MKAYVFSAFGSADFEVCCAGGGSMVVVGGDVFPRIRMQFPHCTASKLWGASYDSLSALDNVSRDIRAKVSVPTQEPVPQLFI